MAALVWATVLHDGDVDDAEELPRDSPETFR